MCTVYRMPGAPQIRIDLTSAIPVYRQIVDAVRTLCVEGALKPGDELPSVRRLAIDLGVHFNTVAEAYRTLAEEGWLDVSHGRSARVLARDLRRAKPDAETLDTFRLRLRQLVAEMRSRGVPRSRIEEELRAVWEGMRS
jgi:GntR family transcriptional regulator